MFYWNSLAFWQPNVVNKLELTFPIASLGPALSGLLNLWELVHFLHNSPQKSCCGLFFPIPVLLSLNNFCKMISFLFFRRGLAPNKSRYIYSVSHFCTDVYRSDLDRLPKALLCVPPLAWKPLVPDTREGWSAVAKGPWAGMTLSTFFQIHLQSGRESWHTWVDHRVSTVVLFIAYFIIFKVFIYMYVCASVCMYIHYISAVIPRSQKRALNLLLQLFSL